IKAPANAPNTDGVDPSGQHQLIQYCNISTGDDNIAVKAGSAFCSDLTIADCTFGTGHGVSIGGQSNRGLDGMLVKDCTFTGTTAGLRMKADATQGGIVQNVKYTNLTMNNVQYPIEIYSYYKQVGNPGATGGNTQTTPQKVNNYNATPPNSLASQTLPAWRNITIDNVKGTGMGYSVIWGLALDKYFIENVTLHDVQITGAGVGIFDAGNVQFTGNTNLGKVTATNSVVIVEQPKSVSVASGGEATFHAAAAGTSGVKGTAAQLQWMLDEKPLADGKQADGSTASGATTDTLKISGVKSGGKVTLKVSNTLDSYDVEARKLVENKTGFSAVSEAAVLSVK
ncbi:MAG TPA: glycosyl hydrolase family 28 protein, partial [Phycisphaerae bacterium]